MRPDAPSDPPLKTVDLSSGPVAYAEEGGGGPCVVAIHGLPGSTRDYRWLAPAFAPHRFIRMDLPGFGETPAWTAPDFDPESRAQLVIEFIETLALGACVIVGHSMGAVVATAVADTRPDLVARLVLIASPGLWAHRGLRRMPTRYVAPILRTTWGARVLERPLRSVFRQNGFRGVYPRGALVRTILGVDALDIDAHATRLGRLKVPALVVWCEDDPLIEPEVPRAIVQTIPNVESLAFPDGGHNPQKHHAVEIAARVFGPQPPSAVPQP